MTETIILIHGFPTSSFDYKKSIDLLSKDYRLKIGYDYKKIFYFKMTGK